MANEPWAPMDHTAGRYSGDGMGSDDDHPDDDDTGSIQGQNGHADEHEEDADDTPEGLKYQDAAGKQWIDTAHATIHAPTTPGTAPQDIEFVPETSIGGGVSISPEAMNHCADALDAAVAKLNPDLLSTQLTTSGDSGGVSVRMGQGFNAANNLNKLWDGAAENSVPRLYFAAIDGGVSAVQKVRDTLRQIATNADSADNSADYVAQTLKDNLEGDGGAVAMSAKGLGGLNDQEDFKGSTGTNSGKNGGGS